MVISIGFFFAKDVFCSKDAYFTRIVVYNNFSFLERFAAFFGCNLSGFEEI